MSDERDTRAMSEDGRYRVQLEESPSGYLHWVVWDMRWHVHEDGRCIPAPLDYLPDEPGMTAESVLARFERGAGGNAEERR